MRRRSRLPQVALAIGALALALALSEAGVRWVAPEPLDSPLALNRGGLIAPGDHRISTREIDVVVHVNAEGFVDREWDAPVPGRERVVVVGDSFVQAAQVPLEAGFGRVLDAALGPEVEVLSMGVPGAGTATALHLVEEQAIPRQADLVVLGFLVANDVLNNHPLLDGKTDKPYYRLDGGALVPWAADDASVGWIATNPLWRHSALVRKVGRTWLRDREARRRLDDGRGVPIGMRIHDPDRGPEWEDAWAVTEALVAAIAARCAENGVGFGILLFPDAVQVSGGSQWDVDAATREAERRLSPYAPVLDLTPALRQAEGPLYYADDGHWTERGHAAAARGSAEAVRGWLGLGEPR